MNRLWRALITAFLFFITPVLLYAQPANDDCSNAVLITSSTSCVNTAGTIVNATYNPSTFVPGCGATNKVDVWYRFVAQASTQTITVSSAPSQVRLELFSGVCGSLSSLTCSNTSITATGLTVGNTYYIRVYTQNNNTGTFNICVTHAPPANDDCAGAISLTSNPSCVNTASTLNLATANGATPLGCFAAGTYYDVWFSFIASASTETITISSLGANIANPKIQLYSGTCAALTSLTCGTTTVTNAALSIGSTYYVRVANLNADPSGSGAVANFNICVTHTAPANDNCSGAISLTSGTTCANTGGTLVGASYTTISPIGCGVASRNDVWYSFVAVSSTTTITLSSAPANPRIQLFSGSCASLTSVACGTSSLAATGLTVGNTYYVRVYTDPNASGTFNICVTHTAPANDDCAGAISLNSLTTCVNTPGTLNLATANGTTPLGCFAAGTYYDVWYYFVAAATTETITLSGLGANITNPKIQLYSGTCAALTSIACGTTSVSNAALTVGNTYYVRVANLTTDPSGTGSTASFNICVTHTGLANDVCPGSILLTSSTAPTCNNTAGTLNNASPSSGLPACGSINSGSADVWYSFVAQSTNPTINVTETPAFPSGGSAWIQLFSACGGSSLGCAANSFTASALTIGNTYLVRVVTNKSIGTPASGYNFNICITDPAPPTLGSTIDYSKSYINVTKLSTGGSVEPGDVLEIRATFVVRSGTVDSVAFYDTLQSNNGFTLLPGNIATQTNEGKIYRRDSPVKSAFTDAFDSDNGWYSVVGADTAIQINMGIGATGTKRGTLSNTSRPSVYGGTCIIMATYRVQVYAAYNTKINWGGGAITYKDNSTGIMKTLSFKDDSLVVYISPGLCSSALSTVNKVGIETNGTFSAPSGATPLARNRGTSTAVPSYTYAQFSTAGSPTPGGGPNDYYYGITNNTSATYTTTNTYTKSTLGSSIPQRVFSHWDITGDHTGAANTAKGNRPCDINLPVSTSNPCGYMLVVNAAYKTDTAFKSTITNLCPNTYYEVSAWVKNICYKCGCDSNGVGAASNPNTGYIPLSTNDSSGVQPNLAFQINGQDYYSTGNLAYTGTGAGITQMGSDSVNTWVKRGFVYKTEATQTGFEFLIRNNAPGGGGNDWAIDDIVVSTCLPLMTYSPSTSPNVCMSNTLRIYDTIRSTYENYTNYKWQRSTDGGSSWSDIGGATGNATPYWNGTAWQYQVYYDIPTANTTMADSADLYRMIVATTTPNLADANCQFTEAVNIITLNVIDCGVVLNTDLLSFNGKLVNDHAQLFWSTSKENELLNFDIEKSSDGVNFIKIGSMDGYNDFRSEVNHYSFIDPANFSGKSWYRIVMKNKKGGKKYSGIIQLTNEQINFGLGNVINPFRNELAFEISTTASAKIDVSLIDLFGKTVKNKSYMVFPGVNGINLENTGNLSAGIYILQVKNKDIIINSKVLKK